MGPCEASGGRRKAELGNVGVCLSPLIKSFGERLEFEPSQGGNEPPTGRSYVATERPAVTCQLLTDPISLLQNSACQLVAYGPGAPAQPDKTHCLLPSLTGLRFPPGMLLQKRLDDLSPSFVSITPLPPSLPQAVLPPAGPACTAVPLLVRFGG